MEAKLSDCGDKIVPMPPDGQRREIKSLMKQVLYPLGYTILSEKKNSSSAERCLIQIPPWIPKAMWL